MSSLINRFTDNPDPPLVVATLLLSLLTGNLLGRSITQAGEEDSSKTCPEDYQLVYVQGDHIYVVRERSFSPSGEARVKVKDGYYCRPEAGGGGSSSGGNNSFFIACQL